MIANLFNALRPFTSRAIAAAASGPFHNGANLLRFIYLGVSLASLPHIWEVWGGWLTSLAAIFLLAQAAQHAQHHPARHTRVKLSHRGMGLMLSATTAVCLASHFNHMIRETLEVTLSPVSAWAIAFVVIAVFEAAVEACISE